MLHVNSCAWNILIIKNGNKLVIQIFQEHRAACASGAFSTAGL